MKVIDPEVSMVLIEKNPEEIDFLRSTIGKVIINLRIGMEILSNYDELLKDMQGKKEEEEEVEKEEVKEVKVFPVKDRIIRGPDSNVKPIPYIKKGNVMKGEKQKFNPYHGSDVPMRLFLADLDNKFEGKWVHIQHSDVEKLLSKHNKKIDVLRHKLRKLKERGHCKLRGKTITEFFLMFKEETKTKNL